MLRAGPTLIQPAAIGLIASIRRRSSVLGPRCVVALAFGVLVFCETAIASSPATDLQYRVWTTEEGLPQGSVRAIAQTPDGYIWIATLDGLVRFDGAQMTVFSRSDVPEMSSNRCVSLLVDRRGTLWVGTEDGGILQWVGARVRAFGRSSGLESQDIGALEEDLEGRVWAATSAGWVFFEGDRWRRSDDSARLPKPHSMPDGLPVPVVPRERRLKQLGQLWTQGANGRLWVVESGHVHRREDGVWQTFATRVPSRVLPQLTYLFEDREGSLWIGSEQGGLVQASPTAVRGYIPEGPLDRKNVYTLAEDPSGRVWVGTQGPPLLWERGAFTAVSEQPWWPRAWIWTIQVDADGSLLGGSPAGLFRIWPGRGFEKLGDLPYALDLLRDRGGTLWVAAAGGLFRTSATEWKQVDGLPSPDVKVLHEARDGAVWVGTYGGLARVADGMVRTWTTADGLSSDRIRSLLEDEAGALWIGTYDGGLNRFANGAFVAIRKRDGLYDDGVFAILDGGDGRYYLSSNRGISSVSKRELDHFTSGAAKHVTYRAWRSADGMPSSECNGGRQPAGFRAADGTLWFPTQGGIAVIDPRAVLKNTVPPLLIVEEVTTERRTIPTGEPITLAPGERRLEVRYTAATFVRPEGARFRHQLVGFDDDWVDVGTRRFALYSYIPPGQYVLRILGANSDGVWSPEGVSLPIRVVPHWWQTLWFRSAAAVLVLAALAAAYQRRGAALQRRQQEQATFARRLIESQEAERKRIASELHDGIGQTLVIIRNRALLGLREHGGPGVVQQVNEISTVAGEGIEEVRRIARGLRPYQLDRLGMKRALEALIAQTSASSGIPIEAEIGDVDGVIAKGDEINVYRIVQEGVNNIVRHAQARSGRLAVVVGAHEIEIRIDDDGRGFDPSAAPGFGLTGIAERSRILGGTSVVRSSPGHGTSVAVHIPLASMRSRDVKHP